MSMYEAQVRAVENILSCLNDEPFKPQMSGVFFNRRSMAEAIVMATRQVELEYEYAE